MTDLPFPQVDYDPDRDWYVVNRGVEGPPIGFNGYEIRVARREFETDDQVCLRLMGEGRGFGWGEDEHKWKTFEALVSIQAKLDRILNLLESRC